MTTPITVEHDSLVVQRARNTLFCMESIMISAYRLSLFREGNDNRRLFPIKGRVKQALF
jgi:hypothetical protein